MSILGLDLGQRILNIALSNSGESISLNKETFLFLDDEYDLYIPKIKGCLDREKN